MPTKQNSNLAFHINAPFFGQINRKNIDFSIPLNKLYIKESAQLIFEAIIYLKKQRPAFCENAVIDLLSFNESFSDITLILFGTLKEVLKMNSLTLPEWNVLPYTNCKDELCFGPITQVYILNEGWDYTIFSKENLIQHLSIKLISSNSEDRIDSVRQLAKLWNCHMEPTDRDKANWAERMAAYLHKSITLMEVWQSFYEELINFIYDSLRKKFY